ncbi:MAG: hypothetical protein GF350_12540 [Chitinivibrionales bacterium]|nr:hypothetical protein [Chitinivibrionales bacterium]
MRKLMLLFFAGLSLCSCAGQQWGGPCRESARLFREAKKKLGHAQKNAS